MRGKAPNPTVLRTGFLCVARLRLGGDSLRTSSEVPSAFGLSAFGREPPPAPASWWGMWGSFGSPQPFGLCVPSLVSILRSSGSTLVRSPNPGSLRSHPFVPPSSRRTSASSLRSSTDVLLNSVGTQGCSRSEHGQRSCLALLRKADFLH